MNREIKFRGKRLNGQWAYGLLCHDPEKGKAYDSEWFISNKAGKPYAFAIAPYTIGQYTGLKDKNGNEIYEGDILSGDGKLLGVISVSLIDGILYRKTSRARHIRRLVWCGDLERGVLSDIEVVGNIHDNPELIKL